MFGHFNLNYNIPLLANETHMSEHVACGNRHWICTYSETTCTLALTALGLSASGCESCLMVFLAWRTSGCSQKLEKKRKKGLMRLYKSKQITGLIHAKTSCFGLIFLQKTRLTFSNNAEQRAKGLRSHLKCYYVWEKNPQICCLCLFLGYWFVL